MSTTRNPDELYGLLMPLKDGDRVVHTVGTPGLFGELALIESEPRALTAEADTDVELVDIAARQSWGHGGLVITLGS
jgi:hypothetical protein